MKTQGASVRFDRCSFLPFPFYLFPLTCLVSFSGCMLATQKDMMTIDDHMTMMRKNQADLIAKMTDLSANLESLNSQLESSQQQMTSLSQKLDDLQADVNRRMNVLSGQVTGTSTPGGTTPGDAYRLAMNDYQAGKFDLALIGFKNVVSQFPKADLTPQAQFQVGECEFGRKNYLDAAREYEKVVQLFPKSDIAPKALFKKGISLQSAGRDADAQEAFRRVIREYPRSDVAKSAKDLLDAK